MSVFGQKLYHQESMARNGERDLDLESGRKRSATRPWISTLDPKRRGRRRTPNNYQPSAFFDRLARNQTTMLEFLRSNWSDILWHIAQHLWLVFISIPIAMVLALPLGFLITRPNPLRPPVLVIPYV